VEISSVKTESVRLAEGLLLSLCALPLFAAVLPQEQVKPWSAEIEQGLARAKDNRSEIEKALRGVRPEQRKGMEFLIANMCDQDLRSLKADFLLENVELAYKARGEFPWCQKVSEEIFLNNVLPYANVDETRHPWRKEFYDLCAPVVKDCKTAAEAAQKLNQTVFNQLNVKYSTKRKKANQSPKESIEQGLASCTGLSIVLIDACRSVGIPARMVGTALWIDKSGNHNWVEIWDGDWHFTGACEPDPKGLDRGWFVEKASQAIKDVPKHAIFAVSYQKTGLAFPLVWASQRKDVYGENVTDRYTRNQKPDLPKDQQDQVTKVALSFFTASPADQAKWPSDSKLDELLAQQEEAVRQAVWKAYQSAPIHAEMKKDFDANQVRYKEHLSPYVVRKVGSRPEKGWPLVIAMHGGGNTPKAVNDSQWKTMQRYYRDQPSVTGYQYLALRAPNDTWNGFYDEYVPPLIMNLIRSFVVLGDVDPDKVYLIGYSHGGYGAFYIGPKIPDRFAAIHCSAGAPTDGTISPLSLRNTRFTFMVGENDTAYGRRERCEKFNDIIVKLKEENKGDFPVEFEFKKGFGHGGLPDKDKIKEMYPYTRNAVPSHLSWEMTDSVLTDFFWLSTAKPEKGQSIDAMIRDNKVEITTKNTKEFNLDLDGRLVAFDRSLQVSLNGKSQPHTIRHSFVTLCRSVLQRGDPQLACTCKIQVRGDQ
jgi:pimeloyl-ACP methyl ester carboxylesterase